LGVADEAAVAAYKAGSRVARVLPGPAASFAGWAAGLGMANVDAQRRRMVARHLQRIHGGQLSRFELWRAVQRSFESYARYWVEALRLPGITPTELDAGMSVEGFDQIDRALERGTGAILALAHLGGWDWGGAWMATQGFRMTVVVEPLEPPEMFEWFADFRRSLGMSIVPLGPEAGGAVLKALRNNEIVGLLCDRDISGGGVEVEFFGERTTLPAGPATLALRTGAPLLPAAVYFEDHGRHRGVIRPALDLTRQGSLREDVARLTQALAAELEELIRPAPEQWHVFQPNWPSDHEG
jgi:phosphatidylinositol dimannoside acyltransferase